MAKYYGTYSCGHEGYVEAFGPTKQRQWKIEKEFSGMCPECCRKIAEEQRRKENAAAKKKSEDMELPDLTGSEKQIAWANVLRLKFIDNFNEIIEKIEKNEKDGIILKKSDEVKRKFSLDELKSILYYACENKTESKYFIDTRYDHIISIIFDLFNEWEKYKEESEIPDDIKTEMEKEKAELTVTPENGPEKNGIVKIIYGQNNGSVQSIYEKDDYFRSIVKEYGYKWNGDCWEKEISEFTGSADERAAELGNALLDAGFTVRFPDKSSKEKAISASFEKECYNWIKYSSSKEKLFIRWNGWDDSIYKNAIRLPGAKYSNGCVYVPIERYREVNDFADTMGFKFSKKSLDEIEKLKLLEENFEKVNVDKPKEMTSWEDKLKQKLEKTGVIEDLRDEIE